MKFFLAVALLLAPLPALAQSFTMPGSTDTLVGRTSTDTLTNKTIDCSTNTCSNVPNRVTFGWIAGADIATYPSVIYTAESTTTVLSMRGRVSNPVGSAATVTVYKAASGTACASGTNQASAWGSGAAFDANGTASTNQLATLAGGAANVLAAGDTLCAVGSGTFSTGVGSGALTIKIQVQ
jgi:hypothetical protein